MSDLNSNHVHCWEYLIIVCSKPKIQTYYIHDMHACVFSCNGTAGMSIATQNCAMAEYSMSVEFTYARIIMCLYKTCMDV